MGLKYDKTDELEKLLDSFIIDPKEKEKPEEKAEKNKKDEKDTKQ